MKIKIKNTEYELLIGSDIQRDGMFIEASISNTDPLEQVAEVFYSDQSHDFEVSCFKENLPLELIEILISKAKEKLPETKE